MKHALVFYTVLIIITSSCGNAKKDDAAQVNDNKIVLQRLKAEQKKVNDSIAVVEAQLAKTDTAQSRSDNQKLVSLTAVKQDTFSHFIEIEGKVDARNISYVAPPNGTGGIVKALYLTQGQTVKKGQLLAVLDDQLIRQQLDPLQVQLNAAEDTYKRTKNLWDQGIGTYQSVLNANTQAESLRKQMDIIRRQIALTRVTAPTSGVADIVNVRVGEAFTGMAGASPQIRIVNTNDLRIVSNVPETYLGRVKQGSRIQVILPEDNNRQLWATVSVIGRVIDPNTRTFNLEARIPSGTNLKPNELAKVHILDYSSNNAITAPVNTVQSDESGKFVMVAVQENGKLVARKRMVTIGQLYGDKIEIKSGLQAGDQLISDGFQGLYDGQFITTQAI